MPIDLASLVEKQRYASYMATQMCFNPDSITSWIPRLRAQGVSLPIHLGVPGVDKGGNIPNLGYVDADLIAKLDDAVFNKAFAEMGMPDFTGKLKPEDLEKIKAFIQGTADAVRPK